MHAVGHVESHVNGIHGYFPFYCLAADSRLRLLLRKLAGRDFPGRNRAEPFLCQTESFFESDVPRYGQDGIVGRIETVEEVFHLFQRGVSNVCNLLADGRPAVRMRFVSQLPQQM